MLKNQGLDTTALIPHSMKVYTILNKGEGPRPDLKIFVNSPFSTCHSFKRVLLSCTVVFNSCLTFFLPNKNLIDFCGNKISVGN